MGITRSFNRHNGVSYAYETVYEWSEEKQKKVQKKRCIGQFVPGTDQIVSNGPRGKKAQGGTPVILQEKDLAVLPDLSLDPLLTSGDLRSRLELFEKRLNALLEVTRDIIQKLDLSGEENDC